MTEVKHTAGPWTVHNDRASGIGRTSAVYICNGEGWPDGQLARVNVCDGMDEQEANARLIAAAPDLFSELDCRVGDLVMLRRAIEEGDPKAELLLRIDDMLRESRAALSLATVEECLMFIAQHSRTIAERNARLPGGFRVHRCAYVIHARKMLALRLRMYREAVRRVSEAQIEMDGIGQRYALSSYDWRMA